MEKKIQRGIYIFNLFIFLPPKNCIIYTRQTELEKNDDSVAIDDSASLWCANLMCQLQGLVWF